MCIRDSFNPLPGSKTWFKLSNNAAITQLRLGKMNAGSTEDDVPLERLSSHLQFSTPPSFFPKGIQEGTSPPSSTLGASSGYTRNLASSSTQLVG